MTATEAAAAQTLGCDYSTMPSSPANIVAATYRFVGRYLWVGGKGLTATEVTELHAAGLEIGPLYFESTGTSDLGGAAAGTADGQEANRIADSLGVPASQPIYYATDFDEPAADFPTNAAYLTAAGATGRPAGVYGSFALVEAMVTQGVVAYAVQTEAWSGQDVSAHANIYQRVDPVKTIPGAAKGSWDELVLNQASTPFWLASAPPQPEPAPTPAPPAPKPPTPAPAPSTEVSVNVPVLSEQSPGPNVVSQPVKNLQTLLIAHGFGVGASGADGRFGPATASAVVACEHHYGLGVDSGIAGAQVWTALCNR